jgi:signal transduction histidine kinase
MKLIDFKYQHLISNLSLKNSWKALVVILLGLVLTFVAVNQTQKNAKDIAIQDFESKGNDIRLKLDARFKAHALLLRSGSSFFAASDTITQEGWRKFIKSEKINKNLPGIQGVGYSVIIPKNQLKQHIQYFRKNGFPDYDVFPSGDRGIYTSVIYLEPFSGRNLRAFGYDMFSEPIRRKAMEISRDSDYAILSGKVILVQETNEGIQSGTLMYVPVYQNGMKINTVEERQAAIKGWVYSPYRMEDLMNGILGNWDLPNENRIHLEIYDNDDISDEALLYDSQSKDKVINKVKQNLYLNLPIEFNGKKWTLQFTGNSENISILHGETFIVLISSITISLLLFALSLAFINANLRAKQIHLLNTQLEKLNTDKDRFISILGHDLKNPFNNLLGLSEVLLEDIRKLDIDEIEDIAKDIYKSAIISGNLLEDILMWSRTQQGSIPFNPQNVSLSATCRNIIEILNPGAYAKNIQIYDSSVNHINVYADEDMLKTILLNLVSNAIKFTNSGGKITINAERNSEIVTISVSDNGVGIPPDGLAKLFDISEVLTTRGTAEETGTGLGLLLCKEFIEKHNGTISVVSEEGKGSTFSFTLPDKV